jgi:hypothetical protein
MHKFLYIVYISNKKTHCSHLFSHEFICLKIFPCKIEIRNTLSFFLIILSIIIDRTAGVHVVLISSYVNTWSETLTNINNNRLIMIDLTFFIYYLKEREREKKKKSTDNFLLYHSFPLFFAYIYIYIYSER